MSRLAIFLVAVAAGLGARASSGAAPVQIGTAGWGLANSGSGIPTHQNRVNRDGLPSGCSDPAFMVPTETTTTDAVSYRTNAFQSAIDQAACITVAVSTACSGPN